MWKDDATAADILLAAQDIQQFAAGMTRDKFASDKFVQSAVIFKIIVLGEAAKRLSDEFRRQHSQFPINSLRREFCHLISGEAAAEGINATLRPAGGHARVRWR